MARFARKLAQAPVVEQEKEEEKKDFPYWLSRAKKAVDAEDDQTSRFIEMVKRRAAARKRA